MAAVECASVLEPWRADPRLAGRRECVSTTACDGGDGCGGGGGSGTEGGDGCSVCTIDRRPRAGADGGCCLCTMLSRPRAPSPRWRSSSRSRMSNSKKAASRRRAVAIACTRVGYTHIGYDTIKTVKIKNERKPDSYRGGSTGDDIHLSSPLCVGKRHVASTVRKVRHARDLALRLQPSAEKKKCGRRSCVPSCCSRPLQAWVCDLRPLPGAG